MSEGWSCPLQPQHLNDSLTGQKIHIRTERELLWPPRPGVRSCHRGKGTAQVSWGTVRCYSQARGNTEANSSAPTNLKLPDKKLPVITNNIIFMQHSSARTSLSSQQRGTTKATNSYWISLLRSLGFFWTFITIKIGLNAQTWLQ